MAGVSSTISTFWKNSSSAFSNMAAANATTMAKHTKEVAILIQVVYVIGIIGNAVAIVVLRIGEHRVRNRKHLLLLTSLAANDFIALVGMLASMVVHQQYPDMQHSQYYCGIRVLLRGFGVCSVCIAVTMALERFLALTRPFFYQKQITYRVIRIWLVVTWCSVFLFACFPLLGLGAYYNKVEHGCIRYREATNLVHIGYAYAYVGFGTFLCLILIYCNCAVILALHSITAPRNGGQPMMRRFSKSSSRQRQRTLNDGSGNNLSYHHNAATAEEVAFSRLMITLSVLFMFCWMPQMVTSTLYLSLEHSYWEGKLLPNVAKLSDMLMLCNYVLDPILYVLMRQRRRFSLTRLCHAIAHCFKRNHKNSTESMKSSCCPETVVVSDSSGAEMRPLRALPPVSPFNS